MKPLEDLIKIIAKLPGLGPKSARRIALDMIKDPDMKMKSFANKLQEVADLIVVCDTCHNVDTTSPCTICSDQTRDQSLICVVENISDLWAIEKSHSYRGVYHVLGGALSAIDGITPEKLNIPQLKARLSHNEIAELIIATNPTLEGQTTAHFIANIAAEYNTKSSRLANGIPLGAELDYLDEGTLSVAFKMRHGFD